MWLAGVSVDCSNYNDLASFRQIGVFQEKYFSSGIYFSCLLRSVQKLYLCGNQNVTRNDYSLLFDWQDSNKQTEDMIDYRSYAHNVSSCEIKDWKKSRLKGIRTYELCDTHAVLYQLSYQLTGSWSLCEFAVCP